LNEADKRW